MGLTIPFFLSAIGDQRDPRESAARDKIGLAADLMVRVRVARGTDKRGVLDKG